MTVLLSFEEKTDEARACAQSFCRYKSLQTLENECAQMMLPPTMWVGPVISWETRSLHDFFS